MDMDDVWTGASNARMEALKTVGSLGQHFAPLINPMFMGGPEWPSRPGYQAVDLPDGGLLMCTNGLTDAWENEPDGVGFGLEIYAASHTHFDDPNQSWVMAIVRQLGNVCAGHGGVRGLLDELGALTVELENEGFPEGAVLDNGRVCVLIGTRGPIDRVALPQGEVRFACATVLDRAQYDDVMSGGDPRRAELAASLEWIGA